MVTAGEVMTANRPSFLTNSRLSSVSVKNVSGEVGSSGVFISVLPEARRICAKLKVTGGFGSAFVRFRISHPAIWTNRACSTSGRNAPGESRSSLISDARLSR